MLQIVAASSFSYRCFHMHGQDRKMNLSVDSFSSSFSSSPVSLFNADSERGRKDLDSVGKTRRLGVSFHSFQRRIHSSSSLFCPSSSSLESPRSLLSPSESRAGCSSISSSERKTGSLCDGETGLPDMPDVSRVYVHQSIEEEGEQEEDSSSAVRRNPSVKMIHISSHRKTPSSHSIPPSEVSCFASSSSSSSSPSEDPRVSLQLSSSSSISSPFSSYPLACKLPFSSSSLFLRPPSSLLLPLVFLLLLHHTSQPSPPSSSSSSSSFPVWLSRNFRENFPSLTQASAKKVVGLSRGSIYDPIVDFCFTIPEGSKGQIKAQTVKPPLTSSSFSFASSSLFSFFSTGFLSPPFFLSLSLYSYPLCRER